MCLHSVRGFNRRIISLAVVLLLLPFINAYGVYGLPLWHSWAYNVAKDLAVCPGMY